MSSVWTGITWIISKDIYTDVSTAQRMTWIFKYSKVEWGRKTKKMTNTSVFLLTREKKYIPHYSCLAYGAELMKIPSSALPEGRVPEDVISRSSCQSLKFLEDYFSLQQSFWEWFIRSRYFLNPRGKVQLEALVCIYGLQTCSGLVFIHPHLWNRKIPALPLPWVQFAHVGDDNNSEGSKSC